MLTENHIREYGSLGRRAMARMLVLAPTSDAPPPGRIRRDNVRPDEAKPALQGIDRREALKWGLEAALCRLKARGAGPISNALFEEAYSAGSAETMRYIGQRQTALGTDLAARGMGGGSYAHALGKEAARTMEWAQRELRFELKACRNQRDPHIDEGVTPSDDVPDEVPAYCFRLCGGMWQVRFAEGDPGYFPDLKGFGIIARLLRQPNPPKSITALELMGSDSKRVPAAQIDTPATDEEGLREYEEQIAEYKREIAEANEREDDARAKALEWKLAELTKHVLAVTGFAGRVRSIGPASPAEKARKAVRNVLKRAYGKMQSASPPLTELVNHLRRNIVPEGCTYAYRPEDPPDWNLH